MDHKKMEGWIQSIELVKDIYRLTKTFPDIERYGLSNQMRRAAVSIPSNIAEGASKFSDKDNIRFLNIALGSLSELETQLIISEMLEYFQEKEVFYKITLVRKLIIGMRSYLIRKIKSSS